MYSVLIFGDSISFGRGEVPNKGWVYRFKEEFEDVEVHKGVYNLSIPGETSQSLLKRIEQETIPRIWRRKDNDRYKIVIQIGGNDAKCIVKPGNNVTKIDEYKKNIQELINVAKKLVDEVIIIGNMKVDENRTNPFNTNVYFSNEDLKKYNDCLREISKENSIKFIDIFENISFDLNEYFDGVHPNKKGYEKLYSYLKNKLKL